MMGVLIYVSVLGWAVAGLGVTAGWIVLDWRQRAL